jgi:uncharacterized protein (TIGR02147 family)
MQTSDVSLFLIAQLRGRLTAIQARRPEYSLRAYSRDLGIPAPVLSEVLRGKREVTAKLARKLCDALALSTVEIDEVLSAVEGRERVADRYVQLTQDEFHTISDWYGFAILALLETRSSGGNVRWIAKRLGISHQNAESALAALERLEFAVREGANYVATGRKFRTTQDIPSEAIQKNHRQGLDLAREALFDVAVEMREFSANTFAVNSADVQQLKKELRLMRRRFAKRAEASQSKDMVYRLQIQFFPLTKEGDKC